MVRAGARKYYFFPVVILEGIMFRLEKAVIEISERQDSVTILESSPFVFHRDMKWSYIPMPISREQEPLFGVITAVLERLSEEKSNHLLCAGYRDFNRQE